VELALVIALGLVVHLATLVQPALGDEDALLCARDRIGEGASPYACARYLYPPLFARVFAAVAATLATYGALLVVRVATLLGAAALALHAASLAAPHRVIARLGVAAALLCIAPWIVVSIDKGNVAVLVAAITVLALRRAEERPLAMGALAGLGLGLKPAAVGALLVLGLAPRTVRPPWRFFGACGGVFVAALGLTWRDTIAWTAQRQTLGLDAGGNAAVVRAVELLTGVAVPAWLAGGVVVGIGLALVRRGARDRAHAAAIALWAAVFCVPRVWVQSMSMLVPVVAACAAHAVVAIRRRDDDPDESVRGLVSVLAIAALAVADPLASWPELPRAAQGLLAFTPCVAGLWLALRFPLVGACSERPREAPAEPLTPAER